MSVIKSKFFLETPCLIIVVENTGYEKITEISNYWLEFIDNFKDLFSQICLVKFAF